MERTGNVSLRPLGDDVKEAPAEPEALWAAAPPKQNPTRKARRCQFGAALKLAHYFLGASASRPIPQRKLSALFRCCRTNRRCDKEATLKTRTNTENTEKLFISVFRKTTPQFLVFLARWLPPRQSRGIPQRIGRRRTPMDAGRKKEGRRDCELKF
jgi:hypothetical protein